MLAEDICSAALALAGDVRTSDIRVGLGYTAVLLEDGRCGLAYTLHEKEYESCSVLAEAGRISGRRASDLLPWMKLPDETACAVGLAAANAVIGSPEGSLESDILEMLSVAPEDAVGMIGYFGPLVDPIKKKVRAMHIFERKPIPELGVLADSAAPELLQQCDVVILSATTLLNHTIDGLLRCCGNAREVVILGPTTPFLPAVFKKRGVTVLSGVHVVDAPQVLRVVSEAGGTRHFGRSIRKLTLRIS